MSETSQNKTKKRDRSASEERLIKAGLEMFSKNGFDGTTTRMIAKKADMNESLIARYFDGKAGLLVAIIAKFMEEVTKDGLPYPPQDTLTSELECYVKDRISESCVHEDFAKLVFSQALVDKKFKKKVMETIPMQLDALLVERVQRLVDMKKIRKGVLAQDICRHLDTYMDGVFFFDRILHETDVKTMTDRTHDFVRHFAKAFEA